MPSPGASPSVVRALCALLHTCLLCHAYRIKYFVMRNLVLSRVLSCLSHKHRVVQVDILRLVKSVVALKDDFYHRHIVKHDLLRPLFSQIDCSKDNMITSLVLDLLEYVRVEKISVLTEYIVCKYASVLETVRHAESFDKLRLRYEQSLEGALGESDGARVEGHRGRGRGRAGAEEEDAAYFDGDDDADSYESLASAPADRPPSALRALCSVYHDSDDSEGAEDSPLLDRLHKRKRADLSEPPPAADYDAVPLPPLRAKYQQGDDEDLPVFLERRPSSRTAAKPTMGFNLLSKQLS